MFELMCTVSNAISDVVTIWWVWTILGVAAWLGTIKLSMVTEPDHRREDAAMIGSLVGAVFGFIFPVVLTILPFIFPLIIAAVVLLLVGAFISRLTEKKA